jgi:hypothetical protein
VFLDDELQKSRKPFVPREPGAPEQPLELPASRRSVHVDGWYWIAHNMSDLSWIYANANITRNFGESVGAVYDRAFYLESTKSAFIDRPYR